MRPWPSATPGSVQRIRQRRWATGSARRARALRRLRARRSSVESPPQTPSSLPDSVAQLRQVSMTSQRRQTTFAFSIWRSAGPVFPIGKNSSGSSSRQAARSRHVIRIELLESRTGSASPESTPAHREVFLVPSGQHPSERQDRSQVNEKPISTDAFKVVRTGCAALASLIGNLGFVGASDPAASPATPGH